MGQLPISNTELDNTAKFLSQVGDYTYSLSKKAENGEELSQKEIEQLLELQTLSASLNQKLVQMEGEMFAGVLRFGDFKGLTSKIGGVSADSFTDGMTQIEDGFSDYASLIYDGPFSEHMQSRKPRMTENAPEIGQQEAQDIITKFIGTDKVSSVEITGEGGGDIPTYTCLVKTSDDLQMYAEITKNGGFVLLLLNDRQPENSQMEVPDAVLSARDFLIRNNLPNMQESYYQRDGNTVVINYAYKQGDFIIYTDLVKVKVALDNGEVIGFEAHGYITNHLEKRSLPAALVSEEEARDNINKAVEISTVNKAMIPRDDGSEVFCYELKGSLNDKNFLVYVNIETGAEEKILILLEDENGTLTI